MGLVHEIAAPDALDAARDAIVEQLLLGAPGALRDAKALVALCDAERLDAGLIAETARRIAARRASDEGREGVGAFLDRRPPAWLSATGL
jgi:methylglutaconyl-CoA hydratase